MLTMKVDNFHLISSATVLSC